MVNDDASLIGLNPRRLKAPKGEELPLKGPRSMRNFLLGYNAV